MITPRIGSLKYQFVTIVLGFLFLSPLSAYAEPLGIQRFRFSSGERYLVVEVLDDDLVHFELSKDHTGPNPMNGIYVTPMIDRGSYNQYRGPNEEGFSTHGQVIETSEMKITVSPTNLCVTLFDKPRNVFLTKMCGENLDSDEKKLLIKKGQMQNAYGIGSLFYNPNNSDGDWIGRSWKGRNHGNFRYGFFVRGSESGYDSFDGGGPSVSQFPMLYALGPQVNSNSFQNYGLLLDQVYRMSWDFTGDTWVARTWGDQLRWFVFTGPDIKDLRSDYLELVGRPPMPPRETFGLWISEFGYDNWTEIRQDLDSLRANHFPVDGVALDLQWFGGSFDNNEDDSVPVEPARMGTLTFDANNFPDPEEHIKNFLLDYGVRFMPIEESYIDNRLAEHSNLWSHKYLSRVSDTEPVTVMRDFRSEGNSDHTVWWGRGGMIDWTNPDAGDYWHQQKRLALSKMGITSHWLDLGEPEMYYEHALYYGFPELKKFRHGDIHNVYNFSWAESIFRGYRNPVNAQVLQTALGLHSSPRHFTLSRAGTVGSQRYGGMWSGDVGRNMGNLRAHLNTQMHMSMVGMDYYTSDAGGFSNVDSVETSYNEDSLYTQWFANNCLLDIPLRPHGWANNEQSNNRRFGPDQRGDLKSNLANVRLRYRLTPYLYSLAHHAWSRGEAIFPPLVYHFQGDPLVRRIGNVKMIGKDLLFGVVAGFNQTVRRVYLPQGLWIDFHSLDWYDSHGEETPELQLFRNRDGQTGLFTIPLFARAGAIIPLMHIDKESMNVFGKRSFRPANAQEDEREKILTTQFGVRVFASPVASSFVCCEDDGRTLDYLDGRVRKTLITQQANAQQAHVTVHASQGDFYDALTTRCCVVELITNGQTAQGVTVGGTSLPQLSSQADFDMGKTGWINAGRNRILARSASASVNLQKDFVFEL